MAQSAVSLSFVSNRGPTLFRSNAFTDLTKSKTRLMSSTVRSSAESRANLLSSSLRSANIFLSFQGLSTQLMNPASIASPRTRTSRGAVLRTLPRSGTLPVPRAPLPGCPVLPPERIWPVACPSECPSLPSRLSRPPNSSWCPSHRPGLLCRQSLR